MANYLVPFLEELTTYSTSVPMLDQVEFSPYCFLSDLYDYCRARQIQLQSYTPLLRGVKFSDPRLLRIAEQYGKTPAQIILRWNLELGVSTIPKSGNRKRLEENFSIFDFSLSGEHVRELMQFHENFRLVDDPMTYW